MRRVLLAHCGQCIEAGEHYHVGSIMMDAPAMAPADNTMQELVNNYGGG